MMFQHHALFPHLDVGANVAFGLRMQGQRGAAVDARVTELLDAGRPRRGPSGATSPRSRAASSSASRWPERWRPRPASCCSTSPSARSTGRAASGSSSSSRRSSPASASRSSRSPTTTPRRSRWPTGSSCSTAAASSRPVRRPRCGSAPVSSRAAELLGFTNLIDVTVPGDEPRAPGATSARPARSARRALIRPEAVRVDPSGTLEGTVVAGTFAGARGRLRIEVPDAPALEADLPAADLPPVGAVGAGVVRPVRRRAPARLSAGGFRAGDRAPYDASGSGSSSCPLHADHLLRAPSSPPRRPARGPGHRPRRVRRAGAGPGRRR